MFLRTIALLLVLTPSVAFSQSKVVKTKDKPVKSEPTKIDVRGYWTSDNSVLTEGLLLSPEGLAEVDCENPAHVKMLQKIVVLGDSDPLPCKVVVKGKVPTRKKRNYNVNTSYDDKTGESPWRLSLNGKTWWSCEGTTLVIRNAKSGKVKKRIKETCGDYDGNSGPLPSPNGKMAIVQGEYGMTLVRDDGVKVAIEEGISSEDIQAIYGSHKMGKRCVPAPRKKRDCFVWECTKYKKDACGRWNKSKRPPRNEKKKTKSVPHLFE